MLSVALLLFPGLGLALLGCKTVAELNDSACIRVKCNGIVCVRVGVFVCVCCAVPNGTSQEGL